MLYFTPEFAWNYINFALTVFSYPGRMLDDEVERSEILDSGEPAGEGAAAWRRPALRLAASREADFVDTAATAARAEKARSQPLRFYLRPGTEELHRYRISAIFESQPEVDHIVVGMIRNGYENIRDLHAAQLRDVFADVDASLAEQRRVIESLKGHLRLSLGY